jgi:hypothetical protein
MQVMTKLYLKLKTILTSVALLVVVSQLNAQNQIVNLGFENWDNPGTTSQEPVGWNSFMNAENNGVSSIVFNSARAQQVERSTDTRPGTTGSFSARIWSRSIFGVVANGNMTTGRIMVGSTTASNPNNHNKTKTGDPLYNQSFTGLPDSMVVWVKYTAAAGNEARISATIHGNYDYRDPEASDPSAANFVVGRAVLNYPPTNGWQRLSIPFDYNFPHSDPRYVLITFTTNKTPGGGAANDAVFIDDLQFIYVPKVNVAPTATQNLIVTQNGTQLTATENFTAASREWKFSTVSGSGYTSFATAQTGATYTPNFSNPGTYYVVCESNNSGNTVRSNEVTINVVDFTSTISSNDIQNIFQNVQGDELTVNESPVADSREWKFSTTAGGPYQSFGTAETGTAFTPLFSNVGTYYVICQSTKSGVVATSNEVEINVSASTVPTISITPSASQYIEVNQNGNLLTANETAASAGREWKFATVSGGPYQSFSPLQTGTTYLPNFAAAGNYYLICESEMNDTIRVSNQVLIQVVDLNVAITPDDAQSTFEFIPGDTLFAVESQTSTSREWKYATVADGPYQSFATQQSLDYYVPYFENAGTYYIVCESNFGSIAKISNEVEVEVGNGPQVLIAPTDTQQLFESEQGQVLTVSAGSFDITSQEWKYTTSVNSTFQSFATPQTDDTYTPAFATFGEYFIRCEAEILGEIFVSNTVKVLVNMRSTSIFEILTPDFNVYAIKKGMVVDLSSKQLFDATIEVANLNGQMVARKQLQDFTQNNIRLNVAEGIYLYNILSGDKIYQGKVYVK